MRPNKLMELRMKDTSTSLLSKFRKGEARNSVYIGTGLCISLLVIVSFILGHSTVSRLTETYLNLYSPPLILGIYWALCTGITIVIFNWFWRAWLSRLRHMDGKSRVILQCLCLCHAVSVITYLVITFEMTIRNTNNLTQSLIALAEHFNGMYW